MLYFPVFVGGGIGAVCRALICSKIHSHYATMFVNIAGAFLIGVLFEYFRSKSNISPETKAFLMTGLLGGFTTFSTYLLDFMVLFERQKTTEAFVYLLCSVAVGILALLIGMKVSLSFIN